MTQRHRSHCNKATEKKNHIERMEFGKSVAHSIKNWLSNNVHQKKKQQQQKIKTKTKRF